MAGLAAHASAQQEQQPNEMNLLSLEDNVLLRISSLLPAPCRQQLRGSCKRLQCLVNELVVGADVRCEDEADEAPVLKCFPNLKSLNLLDSGGICSDMAASVLGDVVCCAQHLTSLSVREAAVGQLAPPMLVLTSLRRLHIRECSGLSVLSAALTFGGWPLLQELAMVDCGGQAKDISVRLLRSCSALVCLRVANGHFGEWDEEWAAVMPACSRLTGLCWRGSHTLNSAVICAMHQCRPFGGWALQELDLSYTRVDDRAMAAIGQLPQLQHLGLRGTNVGDAGLGHLTSLTALTALHVKHCHRVSVEGVLALAPLAATLSALSIGYQNTLEADALCTALSQSLPNLAHLDLLTDELTDAGLEAVGNLKGLRALLLWQAAAPTATGLDVLLHRVHLTRLTLYACQGMVSCGAGTAAGAGMVGTADGIRQSVLSSAAASGPGGTAALHAEQAWSKGFACLPSGSMVSRGMAAIIGHVSLVELHLGALGEVHCMDLAALCHLPALQRLTFEDMPQVEPDTLRALLAAPALQDLCVCGCEALTGQALLQLLQQPVNDEGRSRRDGSRAWTTSREITRGREPWGATGSSNGRGRADAGREKGRRHAAGDNCIRQHGGQRGDDSIGSRGRVQGTKGKHPQSAGDALTSTKQQATGRPGCSAPGTISMRASRCGALPRPAARLWALPTADFASDEEGEEWLERRRRSPMYQRISFA